MSIRPPFQLYTLTAEPTTMNSPTVPAVALVQREDGTGDFIRSHTITPEQARDLALMLIDAAHKATAARAVEDEVLRRLQQAPGPAPTVTVLASTIHRALTEAGVPVLLVRDSIHAARAVAKLLP